MKYIVILSFDTEEILARELSDADKELLSDDHMLYTDDGVVKLFKLLDLDPNRCLWMFTNTLPKLEFV